jgi:MFS transporter, SP family, general alpha glucoside:H+ symporter
MATDPEINKDGITVQPQDPSAFVAHVEKSDVLIDMAQGGTEIEHSLGTLEAARIYWKAVTLAVLLTLTIIMRGYDASVANSFFGLPAFRNRFGYPVPGHGNQIPASWQSALGIANTVGQVFGSTLVGWPMEWWGRRRVLAACLLMTSAIVPMEVFAPSIQVLAASEYIMGFIAGSYQVLIPTYSAEILPTVLRPYLAAYINANYNIGGLLLAGITDAFDNWTTEWGYKIPFALQWLWPVIILPALYLTPESPWWLVRQNKTEEARKALTRLSSPHPKVDIDKTVSMIQKTTLYEEKSNVGGTFWDCFKGTARRRTEIVIMIFVCQDFAVSPLSASYFFEQLGFTTDQSFDINVGSSAVSFVCAMLSAFILRYFGRRSVFTIGLGVICILQFIIAFLQLAPSYNQNHGFSYAQVTLLIIAGAIYNLSIGPLTYSILTEVPSMKLRSKTIGISIATDAICGIITNFVTPYLVNPGEANSKGMVDFLYGGVSVLSFLWCFFRLPETKHRTFEEIDYLFENKVRTCDFKGYVIEDEALKHDLED